MASVVISGDTSGAITVSAPAVAGTNTLTLPAVTDTLTGIAATQTLTNKTLTSPTLTTPALGTPASGVMTNVTGINYDGYKNRIINSAMVIDQRNAGASVTQTTGNVFPVDRFFITGSVASKFTAQQSSTAPSGFNKSLLITSSSAYSVLAGDFFVLAQNIEGYNVADLNWGTANAKTVTLSFQVYSSLTGTFGGALVGGSTYSYPFTYTISTANTWTTISVTVAGPTSGGTWDITNGSGLIIRFGLGVGTTYSGTAGSWTANNYFSATGATSVVGTSGATFYITGVQLEKGSTATSFDYRPYGTELALCQRYFYSSAVSAYTYYGSSYQSSGNLASAYYFYIVPMRTTATITSNGTWAKENATGPLTIADSTGYNVYITASSTGQVSLRSGSSGYFTFSAEL